MDNDHIANKITQEQGLQPCLSTTLRSPSFKVTPSVPIAFSVPGCPVDQQEGQDLPSARLPVLSHGSCGFTLSKQYLYLCALLPGEIQQPVYQQSTW